MADGTSRQALLGVILAGGKSSRMGGRDKALLEAGDKRLVDYVFEALAPQTGQIIVSGDKNYDLDVPAVPDRFDKFRGPLAGLLSAAAWAKESAPAIETILLVPVDCPGLPRDLAIRLGGARLPAIPEVGGVLQTAFGLWPVSEAKTIAAWATGKPNPSLRAYALEKGVRRVVFDDPESFLNINSPEDYESWKNYLKTNGNFKNQ